MTEAMSLPAKWLLYPQETKQRSLLAKGLNLPEPVAQVLLNRGISTVEEARLFLEPDPAKLHSPFLMKGMDQAVELISAVLKGGRRICVYGDYDVDGVTATALLFSLLQELGGDVLYYLPSRMKEGYGLNHDALDYLHRQGVTFLLTVDCGINALDEVNHARQLGIDVVITDHHQPPSILPRANVVLNPLQKGCPYPFKHLSGVGVAFKLAQALLEHFGENKGSLLRARESASQYLDLVALGTVADLVPLLGENRILVACGLKLLGSKPRLGLKALCAAAGLKSTSLTAENIAFQLAPRLNAAGRMSDSSRSLQLLLAVDETEAGNLALKLNELNTHRQRIEGEIFEEACTLVEESRREDQTDYFLLLAHTAWHPGVLGIVASRLVERYQLPVLLLYLENSMGRGSGRSYGSFDLMGALRQCEPLLESYGGHAGAAGLNLKEENIPSLKKQLNSLARAYFDDTPVEPEFFLDYALEGEEINLQLFTALQRLEPFGYMNARPLFYSKGWSLIKKRGVGQEGKHLLLEMQNNRLRLPGISFNGKFKLKETDLLREIQLAFALSVDPWKGGLRLEVNGCVYADEYGHDHFFLVDGRGIEEKDLYLKELLCKKERVLLFVNTTAKQRRLDKFFAGQKNVYFSHQGTIPAQVNHSKPELEHLILYDLPLAARKLKDLISFLVSANKGTSILTIHLLYNTRDFQDNLRLLLATVPSLRSLEVVFYHLQELAAGASMELDEALTVLQKKLRFPSTRSLLEKNTDFLLQAGYLEINEHNKIKVKKVDEHHLCHLLGYFVTDRAFLLEKNKWEQSISWQNFLLGAAPEKIAKEIGP